MVRQQFVHLSDRLLFGKGDIKQAFRGTTTSPTARAHPGSLHQHAGSVEACITIEIAHIDSTSVPTAEGLDIKKDFATQRNADSNSQQGPPAQMVDQQGNQREQTQSSRSQVLTAINIEDSQLSKWTVR